MLLYEYKLRLSPAQQAAIDEAIRTTQFIRNKALRLWMDGRGVSANDLQLLCARLAQEYPFAARLNSQARQAAASRAWAAIERFYTNCREQRLGKKGYPRFQRDCRSVEYKQTGWQLDPDGKRLTLTDGCGIGRYGSSVHAIWRRSPSSRSSGCGCYAGRMGPTPSSSSRWSDASAMCHLARRWGSTWALPPTSLTLRAMRWPTHVSSAWPRRASNAVSAACPAAASTTKAGRSRETTMPLASGHDRTSIRKDPAAPTIQSPSPPPHAPSNPSALQAPVGELGEGEAIGGPSVLNTPAAA